MAQEDLDALLSRMEAMATAVNAFSSETVQHEAFSALIAAFDGSRFGRHAAHVEQTKDKEKRPKPEADEKPNQPSDSGTKNGAKKRRTTGGGRSDWAMVKDLDLHPKDKISFNDFIEQKKPKSNEDRYAVAVYYLKEILGLPAVTIHHVGTIFRVTSGWQEPTGLAGGLRTASYRKGTIDTANFEDLRTTPTGRNFVEHKLPTVPKAKK